MTMANNDLTKYRKIKQIKKEMEEAEREWKLNKQRENFKEEIINYILNRYTNRLMVLTSLSIIFFAIFLLFAFSNLDSFYLLISIFVWLASLMLIELFYELKAEAMLQDE